MDAPPTRLGQALAGPAVKLIDALGARDAAGLRAVITRAAAYVEVVYTDKLLLIDKRAMLLGLLDAGLAPPTTQVAGSPNAAHWFTEWFLDTVRVDGGEAAVLAAQTPQALVEKALADGYRLDFSISVKTWLDDAGKLSKALKRPGRFALRHVVAAGLDDDGELLQAANDMGWTMQPALMAAARRSFLEWISGDLHKPETVQGWAAALKVVLIIPKDPPTPPQPARISVSAFAADRPSTTDEDPLGIGPDVTAFARLIAYKGTTTPLAIGVFGPWGSGKSTFMERLDREIDRLTDPPAPGVRAEGFVSKVVHIRFNAWTFADANLWASLGSEFFDQLRAGGYRRQGKEIHARLVERVTAHVHELQRTAEATRGAEAAGQKELAKALKERDRAVRDSPAVTQTLLDGLTRLTDERSSELAVLLKGKDAEEAARSVVGAAREAQSFLGRAGLVLTTMFRSLGGFLTLLLIAALGVGIAALANDWWSLRSVLTGWLHVQVPPLLWAWAAATLAPFLPGLWSGLKVAGALAKDTAAFAESLKKADEEHLKAVFAAEAKLKTAAEEAAARRAASERAAKALARYIDPKGAANPPRVLRYILEDDPQTRVLEEQLGLISRTRRLFQAVDEVLRDDTLPRDPETPDRIVIYIDDLDRCTYEQVQKVLQAVHLLLAFERFVVVVGVDQKWVEDALAHQFAARDSDGQPVTLGKDERRLLAIAYLEKIFQLPFWLRPLRLDGEPGNAYGAYVEALTRPPPAPEPPAPPPPPAAPAPVVEPVGKDGLPRAWTGAVEASSRVLRAAAGNLFRAVLGRPAEPLPPLESSPEPTAAPAPAPADGVTAAEALETLALDPKEAAFLASPAIGAVAGTTPRNVKRMINMYRIVRVRLADAGVSILGGGGVKPAYPLIAFFAALETGQPANLADAIYRKVRSNPSLQLRTVLTDLNPTTPLDPPTEHEKQALGRRYSALIYAEQQMDDLRGGPTTLADCIPVARQTRRYSFNPVDLPPW